jgi:hypothetical protein
VFDLDMLIGQLNGSLIFYRNRGSSSVYNFEAESFDDIQVESNSAPELIDRDNDGDLDLIVGSGEEGLFFYWNASASNFHFQQSSHLNVPRIGANIKPAVGNLFNGETLDIITGLSTGGLYHLQTETCHLGDLDCNGSWNVLDIVALANCVLDDNCADLENGYAGDLDQNGSWNVLDIVALANCVLDDNCADLENGYAGDLDQNGSWNVLDIVALANCVLDDNCSDG